MHHLPSIEDKHIAESDAHIVNFDAAEGDGRARNTLAVSHVKRDTD